MRTACIFSPSGRMRQVAGGAARRRPTRSVGAGDLAEAAGEALAGGGGPADDEHGVVAGDGAEDLGPFLGVQGDADGLGAAGEGVEHDELADAADLGVEVREQGRERGAVVGGGAGELIARRAAGPRDAGDAHLAQVAGERGLGDRPAALLEEAPQLLLALDGAGADDLADGTLPVALVRHGGRIAAAAVRGQGGAGRVDSGAVGIYALPMHKVPIGVLGASGYAGRELLGLVERHPGMRLAFAASRSRDGERAVAGGRTVTFTATAEAPLEEAALIFSALPHGESAPWVARAREAGAKVVDLSADLRPGGTADAEQGVPYGLTEIARPAVRGASVVANPGCYATAALLALAPLALRGLIAGEGTITINAASGVTGAGFAPRAELLFAEVAEDFRAYATGNTHRHVAEMRAVLATMGCETDLVFTPHLLPVSRGILATITVPVTAVPADPLAPWREQYGGEPFIELTEEAPSLRDVVRRNALRINARAVGGVRQPMLQVIAAIDNLVKGAAGQAMQNANLVLGLEETLGLPA